MKTRKNIRSLLILFVLMFLVLSVYLVYISNTYGSRWFSSPYNTRVQKRRENVVAGDIYDRNGVLLAYSDDDGERKYNDDKKIRVATAHIVGDEFGQTVGAESLFSKYLLGFDRDFYDVFSQSKTDGTERGSDVYLTIDSSLCKSAYEKLEYNGVNGAAVMMNYKTGEILLSVSRPSFDVSYMSEYISGEMEMTDSAMVNRVTMGKYTPGSVFKIVTTVAALRYIEGVSDIMFDCENGLYFNAETGEWLNCDISDITVKYSTLIDYQNTSHGKLSMREAFIHSCNTSYAQLAMMIGSKNLYRTAKTLGINCEFMFSDIVAYSSCYEQSDRAYDIAWSGVGQYTDIMTPLNMCMITAAVANNGYMQEPRLLKQAIMPSDKLSYSLESRIYQSSMSENEASILREYMIAAVAEGTGTRAQLEGYTVGGKTGTAEVTVNGENESHAWFTGFLLDDNHPYAICIVMEYGGSGGYAAAPIAKELMSEAISKGL